MERVEAPSPGISGPVNRWPFCSGRKLQPATGYPPLDHASVKEPALARTNSRLLFVLPRRRGDTEESSPRERSDRRFRNPVLCSSSRPSTLPVEYVAPLPAYTQQ